ncbi:ISL3 family transposase [Streptomyces sp. NPDC005077]|uniref:ISL3 family transposase n=1 Tax=Streptomyces sp. NPDC005077 TaxID=3154292 RepID=UPI0033BEA4DA
MLWTAFSQLTSVTVEEVVVADGAVTFSARSSTRQAHCPGCGTVSERVHGGYRRRLADLAVAGRTAMIDLLVRRFVCPTAECHRKTFVEQIAGLTEPFARRTPLVRQALERVALALAGRPGAGLAAHLSIQTSANSLIRLLRRLPDEPVGAAPRVLGVDDFAFKKGHVYGTILLDMETGERVDVLPDRTAQTLAAWLREHPGVEIVCRDRASAYAEAVRTAAPGVVQVADRFHLWKNLCEATEKCVSAHRACLTETTEESAPDEPAVDLDSSALPERLPVAAEGVRAAGRRERHAAVHELFDKGVGVYAIAKALGLDPKTVGKYAHAHAATVGDVPTSDGHRDTQIRPYLSHLHQRWNEGCTDAARLCTEIRELGYRGSTRTVRRHLQPVRASGKPAPTVAGGLTVRQATRLMTQRPTSLDEDEKVQLKGLLARCPELDAVAECVRTFAEMMNEKRGAELNDWLVRAEATQQPPLRSLARGLRQDFAAVTAGLTLEWNSGKVEGNVNRIKRIKRDGYGRAGFDLLRLQILRAD